MTAITKTSRIMTTCALGLTALRIQTVSEIIIQVVNVTSKIVATMTLYTCGLVLMTTNAPTALKGCPVSMLVPPIVGMNVS
jgi:hypothetical protein